MDVSNPPMASSSSSVLDEYEAILFDLDGVITPTADVHRRAWREVFDEVLPLLAEGNQAVYGDDDYELYLDGRPRFEGVRRLLSAHGVDLDFGDPSDPPGSTTVCAVGNRKNSMFMALLESEALEPYPSAMALVEKLRVAGVRIGLVSSSKNARAVLASAGIQGLFDVVVDGVSIAELGLEGKPRPDPFLEAANLLEAAPEKSVVVEDAIAGVAAGRAGGFGLVVGVARETEPGRLVDAGADVVVADLGELL